MTLFRSESRLSEHVPSPAYLYRRTPSTYGWALAGICAIAVVARLGFGFFVLPPTLQADASTYDRLAVNLVEGHGFSKDEQAPYAPTRTRPPAYPAFLSVIYSVAGHRLSAVVVAQAFLGTLTVLLTFLLAARVFDRRAGVVASAIVALYPAMLYYDTRVLREGTTALLITAVLLIALGHASKRLSGRRLLLLGSILAIVSMSKPETIVLFGPAILITGGRQWKDLRRMFRRSLLIALPIALLWVPWTVRNYVTFGTMSPITESVGASIWFGSRWAETGGDSQTLEDRNALRQKVWDMREGLKESEIEKVFLEEAVSDILQRPTWWLRMAGAKCILFWKDANGVRKTLPSKSPLLADLLNLYYYGLLTLCAIGIAAGWHRFPGVRALALSILIFMLVYAVLHVRNRYRVPILPLVFVASSGGLWLIFDTVRTKLASAQILRTESRPLSHVVQPEPSGNA